MGVEPTRTGFADRKNRFKIAVLASDFAIAFQKLLKNQGKIRGMIFEPFQRVFQIVKQPQKIIRKCEKCLCNGFCIENQGKIRFRVPEFRFFQKQKN